MIPTYNTLSTVGINGNAMRKWNSKSNTIPTFNDILAMITSRFCLVCKQIWLPNKPNRLYSKFGNSNQTWSVYLVNNTCYRANKIDQIKLFPSNQNNLFIVNIIILPSKQHRLQSNKKWPYQIIFVYNKINKFTQ